MRGSQDWEESVTALAADADANADADAAEIRRIDAEELGTDIAETVDPVRLLMTDPASPWRTLPFSATSPTS